MLKDINTTPRLSRNPITRLRKRKRYTIASLKIRVL